MWDFGDGQMTLELPDLIQISHFYPNSGTFNVILTVKDSRGAEGFKSVPIKMNVLPIAIFSVNKDDPNIGDNIAFDASQSSDIDGNITEYRWNFGDGKTADGILATYDCLKGGPLSVKLEVKDEDNGTNTTETKIWINKPPTASFTYTPNEPLVGEPITFNASESMDEDGSVLDYRWDFSDVFPLRGVLATRQPLWSPAEFEVTLTVADDKGAIGTQTQRIAVREKINSEGSESAWVETATDWNDKGEALVGQGKYEEAIQAFDEAIRLDPDYAAAWNNKGYSFFMVGRFEDAIYCSDEAIRLDPGDAVAYYYKGMSLAVFGRFDEALDCYDMAIDLNPSNADAWLNKGLALGDLGRHEEAIQAFDKAIELDPEDGIAWLSRGNALEALGRTSEASEAYAKARELGVMKI